VSVCLFKVIQNGHCKVSSMEKEQVQSLKNLQLTNESAHSYMVLLMVLGVWTLTASVSLLFSSSMTCQLLFIFGINGICMVMMILLVSSPFFMICHTNSDGMDKCTIEPSLSGTYSVFPACKCNMAAIRSSWLDGVTHQQFLTIMHKWRSILTPQSSLPQEQWHHCIH